MNNKVNKIKKVFHTILLLIVLAFMIAFGFHFSCRLKSIDNSHIPSAGNAFTCTIQNA